MDTKHKHKGAKKRKPFWTAKNCLSFLLAGLLCLPGTVQAAPTMTIPQVPLIMASPIHPQVLVLIGNSQSMDGTLTGAIMTGSGALSTGITSLAASSSPVQYTVPPGFTPPLQAADASGKAPYTVNIAGRLYDNGPSRLNMAKAGLQAIIENYILSTDFALATYNVSSVRIFTTWVYYMSVMGSNFTFTNTPIAGNRYVINPCFSYSAASATVKSDCTAMAALYGATTLSNNTYIRIGDSTDDPAINDILYWSVTKSLFVTYSGPIPASPYPPNFSVIQYNDGGIRLKYNSSVPNIGSLETGPTNAGFVPYSPQVLYVQRGFGYSGIQSAVDYKLLVPMTTAGTVPTLTSMNTAINTFLPFLKPETNSLTTTEIKASAVQAPTAGLLKKANDYLNPLAVTSGGGCPQKKYVILISDGLPTQDLSEDYWPPLGSSSAAGYGVTATFNADGTLNSTNDKAVSDAIDSIKALKANNILTYIIGMGAGVEPSVNPQAAATLTAMAIAGGTENYYPATSPEALVNSLNTILISIQNGTFTASAAAVSSTHLNGDTVEYQASFTSNDLPHQDWTGNLKAIQLDPITGIPTTTVNWESQPLLDTLVNGSGWSSSRKIVTWNPLANAGVPFLWASLSPTQQSQLQPSDALGAIRLEYLRGNKAREKQNGGVFRNRSHILGDLTDSQVMYVGDPNGVYLSPSYISFAAANKDRQPLLYVGSNDGMLHAFSADTGSEVFAFIPNAVFSRLANLSSIIYNQTHQYFVNGSPHSKDVQFADSSWHTLLVGGENAGGNSIFALDVTNPAAFTTESAVASAVLWEFTDADMGLSYSQPQIAQIGSGTATPSTFAVFFGNGYNSASNSSVLYALNPQTGTIIKKIDLCAAVAGSCDTSLPQGLSTVATAHKDGLQAQPITHVYAGDLQGNLWSVDVSDLNPSNWSVRLLFKAKDSAGVSQPITTAPVISLHPNYPRKQGLFVLFGTGRLLISTDIVNNQTQSVYGVWDKPMASSTYARTDLQAQTLTTVSSVTSGLSTGILTGTTNTVNWNTQVGWFNDLAIPGERVITNPDLVNGTFVATLNTPPLTACGVGFSSTLLELNYMNGGAFQQAQIDINGDGAFTTGDQYLGKYAVGIKLSNSYATAPNILGPNKNNNMVILITQSDGTQSTVMNPNNTPRKVGWWEIQ